MKTKNCLTVNGLKIFPRGGVVCLVLGDEVALFDESDIEDLVKALETINHLAGRGY